MVNSCWVNGCTSRADGTAKRGFYAIPSIRHNEGEFTLKLTLERRRLWIANINRKDEPTKYSKVCSDHFISGAPASMYDKTNPDWAPTLNLGEMMTPGKSVKKQKQTETDLKRFNRASERQKSKEKHHVARALLELQELQAEYIATPLTDEVPRSICAFLQKGPTEKLQETQAQVQPATRTQIENEVQRLLTENILLKSELNSYKMNQESFKNNNEKVKDHTGLPNYFTLMVLLDIVKPFLPNRQKQLDSFQRLLLTLMRLKLNLSVKDLAYRFKTSPATVSRTFLTVIHILYVRTKHLVYWPDREELCLTMPLEFRQHFGKKTSVIIDCFEIFIQRPKGLKPRAQTWSQYKHHNTAKFLIGITPQGSISYISNGWGGRTPDKTITESCGILDKLLPGDLVLADRGFDIADSVGIHCAEVNIPSFTKGRSQLSPTDVETTRKIAHVRIHVERVIGLVRNKYTITQGKLPIDLLISHNGEVPAVDKIVTVCCALTNMNESVVGFN